MTLLYFSEQIFQPKKQIYSCIYFSLIRKAKIYYKPERYSGNKRKGKKIPNDPPPWMNQNIEQRNACGCSVESQQKMEDRKQMKTNGILSQTVKENQLVGGFFFFFFVLLNKAKGLINEGVGEKELK